MTLHQIAKSYGVRPSAIENGSFADYAFDAAVLDAALGLEDEIDSVRHGLTGQAKADREAARARVDLFLKGMRRKAEREAGDG